MKKVISLLLTVVLLFGVFSTAIGAEAAKPKRTYNYVALGDSIAAGYGLENETGNLAEDPALILTEELLRNPIKEAYPAVFGEMVAEWGAEKGYQVNTANLASCAYRASDVEKTIYEEGYMGDIALSLFGFMVQGDPNDTLGKYHDLYVKYLKDADLVSIQLGGNDLIMGMITPMLSIDNPILQAVGITMTMVFVGVDTKTSLAIGLSILNNSRDKLNKDTMIEAANYLKNFYSMAEECAALGAENVGKVIEAVRTVNSDADIAVLSEFNPYGNSLEYNGKKQDLNTVLTGILVESYKYIMNKDYEGSDEENVFSGISPIIIKNISYPLQYLFAAKAVDGLIVSLNAALKEAAEKAGATYIDVYDISNENNLDPHPDAQRHKEIAEHMADALYPMVTARMVEIPTVCGDANGDGEVNNRDAILLDRYVAGWDGYESRLTDRDAADLNRDSEINNRDAMIIDRYISGWEGYDEYIIAL